MNKNNLNEILKEKEAKEEQSNAQNSEMHLDDAARVKVLSPTRLVMKRFARNRLAIFGLALLVFMFVFCFLGPLFYPYGQKQTFYKYDHLNQDYALAKERTEYTGYVLDESAEIPRNVENKANSMIGKAEKSETGVIITQGDEGEWYSVVRLADNIYTLCTQPMEEVASFGNRAIFIGTYSSVGKSITYEGEALGSGFEAIAAASCVGTGGEFNYGGVTYTFTKGTQPKTFDIYSQSGGGFTYSADALDAEFETLAQDAAAENLIFVYNDGIYTTVGSEEEGYAVYQMGEPVPAQLYSKYVFASMVSGQTVPDEFKPVALSAVGAGLKSFTAPDGKNYSVEEEDGILTFVDAEGNGYAELTTFAISRYNGEDTMEYDLKNAIIGTIEEMESTGAKTGTLVHALPEQDEQGAYVYNEDGELQYEDAELTITRTNTGEYVVNCDMITYLIDRYAKPSSTHLLGTDGDGFDVLARIMYGGRISLMVGFVVVIIETLLGTIMGGIAGYFGGFIDNIIMRLVDIFYCLPMMPIMIIIGAMMDAQRVGPYVRLIVMMAALGIMGWASIARLVRGQILSLREQEFMVATEATGVRVSKRIFRHLVPNVMPQLIVVSTASLGGVILTESTLSFLGLGVKHPLATWGSMINSVSTATAMKTYMHIWVPVGLLICLTVIAFNFVGDGLRDAFDPKSKQ